MLEINLLGQIQIKYNDEDITGNLSNKAVALIYMLIVNESKFLTRDKIIFYLWPESSEEAARYNLRYNLWLLKKNIPQDKNGEVLIIANKEGCKLNAEYSLKCDYLFLKNLDFNSSGIELLHEAMSLFRGEIMAGWYLKNCNEFNELILSERFFCEQKHLLLLRTLAEKYEEIGDLHKALYIYIKISNIDCDNEDLALKIMKLYQEQGNRIAAINHFKKIEDTMLNDLGIAPNEKLCEYYESLLINDPSPLEIKTDKSTFDTETLITLKAIGGIDYFILAQMIKEVIKNSDKKWINSLNSVYISDLAIIRHDLIPSFQNRDRLVTFRPDKISERESTVAITLCNAMEYFLTEAAKKTTFSFVIKDFLQCDNPSKAIIKYLKEQGIANIEIEP